MRVADRRRQSHCHIMSYTVTARCRTNFFIFLTPPQPLLLTAYFSTLFFYHFQKATFESHQPVYLFVKFFACADKIYSFHLFLLWVFFFFAFFFAFSVWGRNKGARLVVFTSLNENNIITNFSHVNCDCDRRALDGAGDCDGLQMDSQDLHVAGNPKTRIAPRERIS